MEVPLAQKLGVHGGSELASVAFARGVFDFLADGILNRAGQHGAARDHNMVTLLLFDAFTDQAGATPDVIEHQAAVVVAWSAYADE